MISRTAFLSILLAASLVAPAPASAQFQSSAPGARWVTRVVTSDRTDNIPLDVGTVIIQRAVGGGGGGGGGQATPTTA